MRRSVKYATSSLAPQASSMRHGMFKITILISLFFLALLVKLNHLLLFPLFLRRYSIIIIFPGVLYCLSHVQLYMNASRKYLNVTHELGTICYFIKFLHQEEKKKALLTYNFFFPGPYHKILKNDGECFWIVYWNSKLHRCMHNQWTIFLGNIFDLDSFLDGISNNLDN